MWYHFLSVFVSHPGLIIKTLYFGNQPCPWNMCSFLTQNKGQSPMSYAMHHCQNPIGLSVHTYV